MIRRAIRRAGRIVEVLFPSPCVICGRAVDPRGAGSTSAAVPSATPPLCAVCRVRLPRMPAPRCRRCGATRYLPEWDPEDCPECADWPPVLGHAAAPFRMEAGAARLVHALKYDGWHALAPAMAREMGPDARRVARRASSGSYASPGTDAGVGGDPLLVPVPLSAARHRERGFNQAALLARSLADQFGWECRSLLARLPGGARQARLRRSGRARNVEGRFRASGRIGRRVILVDDVLTTGATAAACARALEGAGARFLGVVTFARALQPLEGRHSHDPPGAGA